MISLSILDQVPVSEGDSPQQALSNSIDLARMADRLGYNRYWIAEHHNSQYFANSSPEILMSTIAAQTKKIKIGSGGILLQHYSPYKVAENLKLLSTLYPNRIDAGFGRTPGGNELSTQELGRDNISYDVKVQKTLDYLTQKNNKETNLIVSPISDYYPEIWLLGSGVKSGEIAAEKGLSFAFGHFLTPDDDGGVINHYLNNFIPSETQPDPNIALCVNVICAETEEKCEEIAKSMDLMTVLLNRGLNPKGTPSPHDTETFNYTEKEKKLIADSRKELILGKPRKVMEDLIKLSQKYKTNEIIILTITYNHADRLNSYKLLIEERNRCSVKNSPFLLKNNIINQ